MTTPKVIIRNNLTLGISALINEQPVDILDVLNEQQNSDNKNTETQSSYELSSKLMENRKKRYKDQGLDLLIEYSTFDLLNFLPDFTSKGLIL